MTLRAHALHAPVKLTWVVRLNFQQYEAVNSELGVSEWRTAHEIHGFYIIWLAHSRQVCLRRNLHFRRRPESVAHGQVPFLMWSESPRWPLMCIE